MLIEIKGQLLEAKKLQTPLTRRNPNKYSLYHQDHGHDIEKCIQLCDEIKELITIAALIGSSHVGMAALVEAPQPAEQPQQAEP